MRHIIFRFMMFFALFGFVLAAAHFALVIRNPSLTGFAAYEPRSFLTGGPFLGILLFAVLIALALLVKPKKPKNFPRYLRIHSPKGSFK